MIRSRDRQTNLIKGEKDEETITLWKLKKKLQRKLEDKLEDEPNLLIKVENLLRECDKLVETELELDKNKINCNKLIERY